MESTATYYSQLIAEEAEVLLIFLSSRSARTVFEVQNEAQERKIKIGWYRTKNILDALVYHKFINVRDEGGKTLYSLNNAFFDEWRGEKLKLYMKHARAEYDLKQKIPITKFYDEQTCKYFLLKDDK